MRARVYIKIAKSGTYSGKFKVKASTKSDERPLSIPASYNKLEEFLPTVGFAVDFVIPDELFSKAMQVIAEIDVTQRGARVLAELPVVEKDNKKK